MWIWIMLFLITFGILLIGLGQTALMVTIGAVGLITGLAIMIFSVDKEETE